MIVDDHDVVRQGVRALVSHIPGWTICAEASEGFGALKLAAETKPDIVIVDIALPGTSGLDVIVQLKKLLPQVKVLVLSLHDSVFRFTSRRSAMGRKRSSRSAPKPDTPRRRGSPCCGYAHRWWAAVQPRIFRGY
jgi:two-component SAPR family response regulator